MSAVCFCKRGLVMRASRSDLFTANGNTFFTQEEINANQAHYNNPRSMTLARNITATALVKANLFLEYGSSMSKNTWHMGVKAESQFSLREIEILKAYQKSYDNSANIKKIIIINKNQEYETIKSTIAFFQGCVDYAMMRHTMFI